MSKCTTYNEGKIELTNTLGDEIMDKLDKVLSITEKETSKIVFVNDIENHLNEVLNTIRLLRGLCFTGDKKLTRIIINSGNVMKLESFDNGTPIVFVTNEGGFELPKVANKLKIFCKLEELKFRKIEC